MSNDRHDRRFSCANLGFNCMRVLKWIPVIFITSIIFWSYYAFVVELCIYAVLNVGERCVYLVFYHIIALLFFWSYLNTIFTAPGKVPTTWRISERDIERLLCTDNPEQQKIILEILAKDFPVYNRTLNGSIRFCDKCKIIKPDRAHHCSVCGTCILKMDHHCPWVNNCVNFTNYKFFVLFLGYAVLYCLYVALTSLHYFIKFWKGALAGDMGRFHLLFLFFVSVMFAISLISLFGYHIYLVLLNRTTLEAFRAPIFRFGGPDTNGYNLGKMANFKEVFGDNWRYWFLPIYSSKGNGLQHRIRREDLNSVLSSQDHIQEETQIQQQPHSKPDQHSTYNSIGISPITKLSKYSAEQLLNSSCISTTTSQSTSPILTATDGLCIVDMNQKSLSVESQLIPNGNPISSVRLQISEEISSDKNWQQLPNTDEERQLSNLYCPLETENNTPYKEP